MRRVLISLLAPLLLLFPACGLPMGAGSTTKSGGQLYHVYCGQQPGVHRVLRSADGTEVPGFVTPRDLGIWNKSENLFVYYACPGFTDGTGWHAGPIADFGIGDSIVLFPTEDCSGTGYVSEHINYETFSPRKDCQVVFSSNGRPFVTTTKVVPPTKILSFRYFSQCQATGKSGAGKTYDTLTEIVPYEGAFPLGISLPVAVYDDSTGEPVEQVDCRR